MPLHFDVSKVENHQVVTTDPNDSTQWAAITVYLTDMTMTVGICEITAKNAEDFYQRVKLVEAISGSCRKKVVEVDGKRKGQDVYTKWPEVKSHIGLHTNASSLTITEFWKRMRTRHERDTSRQVEFAEEQAVEAA